MKAKVTKTDMIRKTMNDYPMLNARGIARKTKIDIAYVYTVMSNTKKALRKEVDDFQNEAIEVSSEMMDESINNTPSITEVINSRPLYRGVEDNINHPPHYTTGGIETIDFIEAKQLNYHLGNVVKYITRADHKGDRLENLKKAQWYLNRAVDNLTK